MNNHGNVVDPVFRDESFLISLPRAGPKLNDNVHDTEELRDVYFVDYIHYSIVMSRFYNQVLYFTTKLDQNLFKEVTSQELFVDLRIGLNNQEGPKAYKSILCNHGQLICYNKCTLGESLSIPMVLCQVLFFIDKDTNALKYRAIIMNQNSNFLIYKKGLNTLKIQNYEVIISEIEQLLGSIFDESLFNNNSRDFYTHEGIHDRPKGFSTPEDINDEELEQGIVFNRSDAEMKDLNSAGERFWKTNKSFP